MSSTGLRRRWSFGAVGAGAAVAIPAALYLLSLWALHERLRATSRSEASLAPVTVLLILLTPFSGQPVLLTVLPLCALLAIKLMGRHRAGGLVRDARVQKETA